MACRYLCAEIGHDVNGLNHRPICCSCYCSIVLLLTVSRFEDYLVIQNWVNNCDELLGVDDRQRAMLDFAARITDPKRDDQCDQSMLREFRFRTVMYRMVSSFSFI